VRRKGARRVRREAARERPDCRDLAARPTLFDVPRELAWFVAKLLAAERRRRGTPAGSRALTCFGQAVLALRWFRDRTSPGALARDHGISRATGYRYVDEVIAVLAEQAPDLRQALERAQGTGFSHVILDGKIIPADRCKEPTVSVKGEVIDLWYSGKAHCHGGNIQAVLAPDGFPLWISQAEPDSVHDLTAARTHALPALYRAAASRPAHPGRPRLRRRRNRHPHPRQTAHRRAGTRHQCPHPQRHPPIPALPR
jgi:DDE superfamily endonuclease